MTDNEVFGDHLITQLLAIRRLSGWKASDIRNFLQAAAGPGQFLISMNWTVSPAPDVGVLTAAVIAPARSAEKIVRYDAAESLYRVKHVRPLFAHEERKWRWQWFQYNRSSDGISRFPWELPNFSGSPVMAEFGADAVATFGKRCW